MTPIGLSPREELRDARGRAPTPTQAALHAARKARLARLSAAAARFSASRAPPPAPVALEPPVALLPCRGCAEAAAPYVAGDPLPSGRKAWFRIEGERDAEQGPEIRDIQHAVCLQYRVSLHDMLSPRRMAAIVRPRQVAVYLARELTLLSLPQIGAKFGGRDHTTVLVSHRKIGRLLGSDAKLAAEVADLRAALTAPGRVR
ncbi:MAG: helix-turn-helix domain-containing protein [Xanthobacteraceae bacterium]